MSTIQNTNTTQDEAVLNPDLHVDIEQVNHWGIPDRKTRKQWYQSTNPQIRSYITGNLVTNISGKGARSLNRAADEYQYLSEDLARNSYSSKAMSKKYDNFNGIDSSVLDRALENETKQLDTYQQQFNTGQLNERKFNRLQRKHERRINNLNENYQTLSEVWHSKHDIPLVRTQSSVSSAPFLLGTIGLPAAIIGCISGGIAAAPYIGKALANPWVQRGLTGLDVVDTGVQVASGNYLGAATNWIPYDDILKYGKKAIHTSKDVYKTYKQNKLAKQYIKNIDNSPDIYYRGKDLDNRMSASLQNIYSRDRYIENNLEYGPTQRIVDSSLENSMLINGSNVATGVTPKEGGIVSGSSRPHFENGYYVPAKGNIQFQTGETLAEESHPIFFSPNKPFGELPHGKSFTSTYQQFYPDDINNPNTQRTLNPYRKFILDKIKTSDNVPYRFVETPYKSHLNAKPRETGTSWGIEVHVPKVPIEDIRGHEYDPLLKTFRKHLYVDPNTQTSMINPILESLDIPYFKNGSGIHIKKENRGKFTEYCNGKVTQECIDKAKKSNNPTLRKRATFAENSRGWAKKHNTGGIIFNPYLPKSIPFAKMGTVLSNDDDPYYPFYANPTLKEAIFQAFDEGYQGQIIDYKGKLYKAELNEADLAEYNNRKKSVTAQQPTTVLKSKTAVAPVSTQKQTSKRWTDQEIVDNYVKYALWPMENAQNVGYNKQDGKYYVYADSAISKNIGPGIAYTSNLGSTLDYTRGYTKEELDAEATKYLSTLMSQVSKQMHDKYGDAYYNLPLGDRMLLLDLAYQISPGTTKANLPITGWPKLSQALIDGDYETAKNNVSTKQNQERRKIMRQMLLGLASIDDQYFKNM